MGNAGIKILVVDDDVSLRDMFSIILEDEGYQVDTATNGEDAWSMLHEISYNLLITDMFMPRLNGFDLVKKCQAASMNIKTILISGGGDIEAEHGKGLVKYMGQELEADLFLRKPCDLEEMLAVIENLLRDP